MVACVAMLYVEAAWWCASVWNGWTAGLPDAASRAGAQCMPLGGWAIAAWDALPAEGGSMQRRAIVTGLATHTL